jgi:hypothetical protein
MASTTHRSVEFIRILRVRTKPLSVEMHQDLRRQCEEAYLRSLSYEFALGISRRTGLPLIGMVHDGIVLHAGVRDTQGKFFDARGPVDDCDMAELFPEASHIVIRNITVDDMRCAREVSESIANRAACMAQLVWPDLPWNDQSESRRILRFAEHLFDLCKDHGYFVRCGPDMSMQVYPTDGREVACRLTFDITGEGAYVEFVQEED